MPEFDFIAAWRDPLIKAPQGSTPRSLSFLERVGLPLALTYGSKNGPGHLSFERMVRGLERVDILFPDSAFPEQPLPDRWRDLLAIGNEWFDGGAQPLWCVDPRSGHVLVLDVEAEWEDVVNTSPELLARSLVALRDWSTTDLPGRRVNDLRERFDAIEPISVRWAEFCDHLEHIDPDEIVFSTETSWLELAPFAAIARQP